MAMATETPACWEDWTREAEEVMHGAVGFDPSSGVTRGGRAVHKSQCLSSPQAGEDGIGTDGRIALLSRRQRRRARLTAVEVARRGAGDEATAVRHRLGRACRSDSQAGRRAQGTIAPDRSAFIRLQGLDAGSQARPPAVVLAPAWGNARRGCTMAFPLRLPLGRRSGRFHLRRVPGLLEVLGAQRAPNGPSPLACHPRSSTLRWAPTEAADGFGSRGRSRTLWPAWGGSGHCGRHRLADLGGHPW